MDLQHDGKLIHKLGKTFSSANVLFLMSQNELTRQSTSHHRLDMLGQLNMYTTSSFLGP